jgi:hypothetical protein
MFCIDFFYMLFREFFQMDKKLLWRGLQEALDKVQ